MYFSWWRWECWLFLANAASYIPSSFLLSFLEFQKFRLIQSIVLFLFEAGYCYPPPPPNLLYRLFSSLLFACHFVFCFFFFPPLFFLYEFFQLSHNLIGTDWFLTVLPSGNIEPNIFSFQFNSYGILIQYKEVGEASFLNGHSALLFSYP